MPSQPHETPTSTRIAEIVGRLGIPSRSAPVGETLTFDDLALEVLGPIRRYASPNDQSVVLRVHGPNGVRLLLTGDIETHAQADLVGLDAEVLKVPHQGAATSDLEWLASVGARLAVVSVGPNDFGHPSADVVAALEAAGAVVHRTDQNGDAVVDLSGDVDDATQDAKLPPVFRGTLQAGEHHLEFGDVTYVMGVINLSPESKNAHTVATTPGEARSLADRYRQWGADLVEVGGQSSHYDNPTIEADEETKRVVPAVEALVADGHIVVVDTWKPEVAHAAIEAGAAVINDTGGFRSAEMRRVVAPTDAAVIAVYVEGDDPHAVDEVSIGPTRPDRWSTPSVAFSRMSARRSAPGCSSTRGSPSTTEATIGPTRGSNSRSYARVPSSLRSSDPSSSRSPGRQTSTG